MPSSVQPGQRTRRDTHRCHQPAGTMGDNFNVLLEKSNHEQSGEAAGGPGHSGCESPSSCLASESQGRQVLIKLRDWSCLPSSVKSLTDHLPHNTCRSGAYYPCMLFTKTKHYSAQLKELVSNNCSFLIKEGSWSLLERSRTGGKKTKTNQLITGLFYRDR